MGSESHPGFPVTDGQPALSTRELETKEHHLPMPDGAGNNAEVYRTLNYLADQDKRFRDHRPEMGNADYPAFEEHRQRLSVLRQAFGEIGLDADQQQILNQVYGFQRAGRESISAIAREHSLTPAEVDDLIQDVSKRLAGAGWRLERYA